MKTIIYVSLTLLMLLVSCKSDENTGPALSGENQIVSFELAEQVSEAIIDPTYRSITLTVASATDLSDLTPVIEVSEKATLSSAPATSFDFYDEVVLTVTAEDGTTANWSVYVLLSPELKFADVGGIQLEYTTAGAGAHTVVFDVGLDGSMDEFTHSIIYSRLSKNYQVISYHRAGYGNSGRGPLVRTIPLITDELNQLIQAVAINDKVILVGHSAGGAFDRFYAIRFPETTEALLMIDPAHEGAAFSSQKEYDDKVLPGMTQIGAKDEVGNMFEIILDAPSYGNLPDIPTTVLTATIVENMDPQYWYSLHESLRAGISPSHFSHERVNSNHWIHLNDPSLIIEKVDELVSKL